MKYLFVIFSILSLLNCKFENESIIIDAKIDKDNQYVGSQNPIFALKTLTKDEENFFDDLDIEENTHFYFQITGNETNTYDVNCRLWKDFQNYIIIFCDLQSEFIITEEFSIKNIINLEYISKIVIINFNVETLILNKIEGKIPFIYGKSQEIDVSLGQNKIELNFKVNSYNEETLFLYVEKIGLVQLDICEMESNDLTCVFSKRKLDVFAKANNNLYIRYIHQSFGSLNFNNVGPIIINYPNINKENIYFKIDKIVNKEVDYFTFFNFETNITNIDKLKTSIFSLHLPNEEKLDCFFIKHDNLEPLYLSCYVSFTGNYTIENIEGFTESDLHY